MSLLFSALYQQSSLTFWSTICCTDPPSLLAALHRTSNGRTTCAISMAIWWHTKACANHLLFGHVGLFGKWDAGGGEELGCGGASAFSCPCNLLLGCGKLSEQRRNETNLHPQNGSYLNLHVNQRSQKKKNVRKHRQKYPFRCPLFWTVFTNAF